MKKLVDTFTKAKTELVAGQAALEKNSIARAPEDRVVLWRAATSAALAAAQKTDGYVQRVNLASAAASLRDLRCGTAGRTAVKLAAEQRKLRALYTLGRVWLVLGDT